jgi:hypothetical protein
MEGLRKTTKTTRSVSTTGVLQMADEYGESVE